MHIFPLVYWSGPRLAQIEDTKVEKALLTFVNNNKSNFISRCWLLSKNFSRFDSGTLILTWWALGILRYFAYMREFVPLILLLCCASITATVTAAVLLLSAVTVTIIITQNCHRYRKIFKHFVLPLQKNIQTKRPIYTINTRTADHQHTLEGRAGGGEGEEERWTKQ